MSFSSRSRSVLILVVLAIFASRGGAVSSPPRLAEVPGGGVGYIAVIDTGADIASAALADRLAALKFVFGENGETSEGPGWDFVGGDASPKDVADHGSHVAALLAERLDAPGGVGKEARILVLRTAEYRHPVENVVAALRALDVWIEQGLPVQVVLCPFEFSFPHSESSGRESLRAALRDLLERDVLVVSSAGNSGEDLDAWAKTFPTCFGFASVLSVAATNASGHLSATSNYGAKSVDIAAPGFGVSACGATRPMTGTSPAAAIVAAEAMRLRLANPDLDAPSVKRRLLQRAKPHPSLIGKVVSNGYLLLQQQPTEVFPEN